MRTAPIFNIQRFSIYDGKGIRTTVFFKGCPLKCIWCSNPESQKVGREIEILPNNCIGCGSCMKACTQGAISFIESGVTVDRDKCLECGSCASECYAKALRYVGKTMTVKEVCDEIAKDEVFYRTSSGGYTFSGGEPLMYGEFCLDVIKGCKHLGCNSTIETSGYGDTDLIKRLASSLDSMFFDVKHMDSEMNRRITGVSNELIQKNLRAIQENAKEVIIRTPLVPGYNDGLENIMATAKLCTELKAVNVWELLPYHSLGEHKYEAIGREYALADEKHPSGEHMQNLIDAANEIMNPYGKTCYMESSGQKL